MTAPGPAAARLARREDASAIAQIYNQGIEERIATFETEPRTPEDIERVQSRAGTPGPAYRSAWLAGGGALTRTPLTANVLKCFNAFP